MALINFIGPGGCSSRKFTCLHTTREIVSFPTSTHSSVPLLLVNNQNVRDDVLGNCCM